MRYTPDMASMEESSRPRGSSRQEMIKSTKAAEDIFTGDPDSVSDKLRRYATDRPAFADDADVAVRLATHLYYGQDGGAIARAFGATLHNLATEQDSEHLGQLLALLSKAAEIADNMHDGVPGSQDRMLALILETAQQGLRAGPEQDLLYAQEETWRKAGRYSFEQNIIEPDAREHFSSSLTHLIGLVGAHERDRLYPADHQRQGGDAVAELLAAAGVHSLRALPTSEQYLLKEKTATLLAHDGRQIRRFVTSYRENGLRALAFAEYGTLGQLLEVGDWYRGADVLENVLKLYAGGLDAANDVDEFARQQWGQGLSGETYSKASRFIRQRASATLERVLHILQNPVLRGGREVIDTDAAYGEMYSFKVSREMLLAVYKAAKISSLDEAATVSVDAISADEIGRTPGFLADVETLYASNYSGMTREILLDRFRQNLNAPNSVLYAIYIQTDDKKVPLACMLTTPKRDGIYVSALNVDAEFKGSKLGPILIGKMRELAESGAILTAEADRSKAPHYLAQLGFVATSVRQDPDDGVTVFDLRWDETANAALQTKNVSLAAAEQMARQSPERIRVAVGREDGVPDFASDEVLTQIGRTRGEALFVFEKTSRPNPLLATRRQGSTRTQR